MNNQQVAHSFAYGQNGKGSNFYSERDGTLLYSYSSLLARKFENGIILIDERIANYSNTSIRHNSHLIRAIHHMEYYYVSSLDSYCKLEEFFNIHELDLVNKEIIELYKKQKRARKSDYSQQIRTKLCEGSAIIKYGSVDKRSSVYKTFQRLYDGTNADELIEASIIAEKKQKELHAKKLFENNKIKYFNFTGVMPTYSASELQGYNWLKIEGENLKTSGHVTVDLQEAKVLYKAYKSGKKVIGENIGYYTILKANDKEVQIGCHHILTKELDRVLGV